MLCRLAFVIATCLGVRAAEPALHVDVCVYGATASGVAAALAASQEGRSVVVIEPSRWLGGMTGGGIRQIDWGKPGTIGGLARTIFADGKDDPYYRTLFVDLLRRADVPVLYEHRIGRVIRDGTRITTLVCDYAPPDRYGTPPANPTTPGARTVTPQVVIDASYEGDVLALAGVSYTYGRESRSAYGETLAGVRPALAVYDIDPYIRPGDPSSGLLPTVQDMSAAAEGDADHLTMAYCFRWKVSEAADRLPFGEPEHYDPAWYEVLRRGFANHIDMGKGRRMRRLDEYESENGSFFSNNSSRALIALSVAGSNRDYPNGDWATRSRIWAFHREYTRGVMHFLKTDPVVPAALRERAQRSGLQRGLFDETDGWPHQLYVREARRLLGDYVLTQHDLAGATAPHDAIALGSYGVDDWPYATVARAGKVVVQGGEFSILRLSGPHDGVYRIPYRCLTPRAQECSNLLVPVCLSASHIAMTSTRMKPVWTITGESAGVAAALACAHATSVQTVPYAALRARLLARGQKLDP
ncbi:MAG TPA: FAD-dependent oxidoreductase [Planctomycetota bacterium]|nr:FAD-dependent oxidoreductase [Planctomycetota bacterium]